MVGLFQYIYLYIVYNIIYNGHFLDINGFKDKHVLVFL